MNVQPKSSGPAAADVLGASAPARRPTSLPESTIAPADKVVVERLRQPLEAETARLAEVLDYGRVPDMRARIEAITVAIIAGGAADLDPSGVAGNVSEVSSTDPVRAHAPTALPAVPSIPAEDERSIPVRTPATAQPPAFVDARVLSQLPARSALESGAAEVPRALRATFYPEGPPARASEPEVAALLQLSGRVTRPAPQSFVEAAAVEAPPRADPEAVTPPAREPSGAPLPETRTALADRVVAQNAKPSLVEPRHPLLPAAGAYASEAPGKPAKEAPVGVRGLLPPPSLRPEATLDGPRLPLPDLALVADVLRDLPRADAMKLTDALAPAHTRGESSRIDALFRAAVGAAAARDVDRALDKITQLIRLAPLHADTLRTEPSLRRIAPSVAALVQRLESTLRLEAEGRLAEAAALVQRDDTQKLPGWEVSAGRVHDMARRFFDAGTYAGYLRSAELAQLIIDNGRWVPGYPSVMVAAAPTFEVPATAPVGPLDQLRRAFQHLRTAASLRLRSLWVRAPLLILLLGWLGLGLVGGSAWALFGRISPLAWLVRLGNIAFEVWSLGFLTLVGFGFYMRVRDLRFRR